MKNREKDNTEGVLEKSKNSPGTLGIAVTENEVMVADGLTSKRPRREFEPPTTWSDTPEAHPHSMSYVTNSLSSEHIPIVGHVSITYNGEIKNIDIRKDLTKLRYLNKICY